MCFSRLNLHQATHVLTPVSMQLWRKRRQFHVLALVTSCASLERAMLGRGPGQVDKRVPVYRHAPEGHRDPGTLSLKVLSMKTGK